MIFTFKSSVLLSNLQSGVEDAFLLILSVYLFANSFVSGAVIHFSSRASTNLMPLMDITSCSGAPAVMTAVCAFTLTFTGLLTAISIIKLNFFALLFIHFKFLLFLKKERLPFFLRTTFRTFTCFFAFFSMYGNLSLSGSGSYTFPCTYKNRINSYQFHLLFSVQR